jgi:hypothetical protein
LIPEAKKSARNREEKTIHKRKKKELMNVDLENMELLRQQLECRKFYKEINIPRKQFKPRVNICMNENGSLIMNMLYSTDG